MEMMGFELNISLIAKEIRQAVCIGEAEPKGKLFAFPLGTHCAEKSCGDPAKFDKEGVTSSSLFSGNPTLFPHLI